MLRQPTRALFTHLRVRREIHGVAPIVCNGLSTDAGWHLRCITSDFLEAKETVVTEEINAAVRVGMSQDHVPRIPALRPQPLIWSSSPLPPSASSLQVSPPSAIPSSFECPQHPYLSIRTLAHRLRATTPLSRTTGPPTPWPPSMMPPLQTPAPPSFHITQNPVTGLLHHLSLPPASYYGTQRSRWRRYSSSVPSSWAARFGSLSRRSMSESIPKLCKIHLVHSHANQGRTGPC